MASKASKQGFNIVRLSKDSDIITSYITPHKKLRLASLKTDPEAFGSNYERESQFTDDTWESRLKNPLANHLIAYTAPTSTDPESSVPNVRTLHLEDWVAMTVLFGPIHPDEGTPNPNKSPWTTLASQDGDESAAVNIVFRYHLIAVFTMPSARRYGLGYKLIQSALELAKEKERNRNTRGIHFTVVVNKVNEAAKGLYEKCEFVVTKEGKLVERDMDTLTMERYMRLDKVDG